MTHYVLSGTLNPTHSLSWASLRLELSTKNAVIDEQYQPVKSSLAQCRRRQLVGLRVFMIVPFVHSFYFFVEKQIYTLDD